MHCETLQLFPDRRSHCCVGRIRKWIRSFDGPCVVFFFLVRVIFSSSKFIHLRRTNNQRARNERKKCILYEQCSKANSTLSTRCRMCVCVWMAMQFQQKQQHQLKHYNKQKQKHHHQYQHQQKQQQQPHGVTSHTTHMETFFTCRLCI